MVKRQRFGRMFRRYLSPMAARQFAAYERMPGIVQISAALCFFDKQVESNTEVDRLGRKSPRKKKLPRYYRMTYKDL